jgi:hypothetical protein
MTGHHGRLAASKPGIHDVHVCFCRSLGLIAAVSCHDGAHEIPDTAHVPSGSHRVATLDRAAACRVKSCTSWSRRLAAGSTWMRLRIDRQRGSADSNVEEHCLRVFVALFESLIVQNSQCCKKLSCRQEIEYCDCFLAKP